MKRIISIIILVSSSISVCSQTTAKETEKIATFCKLWGFLKYHHPTVAQGELDWDKEFTTRIKKLDSLRSKQAISHYYSQWISSLGEVKSCFKCKDDPPGSLKFNLEMDWISDTNIFTPVLIDQLLFIHQNRNQGRNFYVQQNKNIGNTGYENEKSYPDSIFPSIELRLLGLSRYWNIINYYYPYKYIIGQDWDSVLTEMIPKFKDSNDTISYHLAMMELTAKINDSHAGFVSKYTNQYFGIKWAPFKFKIIENKVIVTGFYSDSLCEINDLRYGDVFLEVDGSTIEEIINAKSKYIGASNQAAKLRNMNYAIFNGASDSANVIFEREGVIAEKTIKRYFFKEFDYNWESKQKGKAYEILDGNIGYVNLGLLQRKQTVRILKKLKNTKAIIFDVRNYPNKSLYHIANFLNTEKKPFAKFSVPIISSPGVFDYTTPYFCGKNNRNPYAGKVIVLFNETSQSHAEFTIMALKTAPDVTTIGSQTAGSDGDVSLITFPGNYKTYMTGIGVYYPDGTETQRVGIVPDIEIKPTIQGVKQGRDELMEKAIELINLTLKN
jgi:C-terminal processing protease CtpA/Prc